MTPSFGLCEYCRYVVHKFTCRHIHTHGTEISKISKKLKKTTRNLTWLTVTLNLFTGIWYFPVLQYICMYVYNWQLCKIMYYNRHVCQTLKYAEILNFEVTSLAIRRWILLTPQACPGLSLLPGLTPYLFTHTLNPLGACFLNYFMRHNTHHHVPANFHCICFQNHTLIFLIRALEYFISFTQTRIGALYQGLKCLQLNATSWFCIPMF